MRTGGGGGNDDMDMFICLKIIQAAVRETDYDNTRMHLGMPSGCNAVAQLRNGGVLDRVRGGDREVHRPEHFRDKIRKTWWSPEYQTRREESYLG